MAFNPREGSWPGWILLAPLMMVGVASSGWIGGAVPACFFHESTGLLCPGCGATRAAMGMAEGRWLEAFGYNGLFVVGVVLGGIWIVLSGVQVRYPEVRWLGGFRFRIWFLWVALGMLLAFGVLRNMPGMEWLGPC